MVQGRGDSNCRVTKFQIKYTTDGNSWEDYENGKMFNGALDRNTHVIHNLKPFFATIVRIVVQEWYDHICFRFDVIFLQNE